MADDGEFKPRLGRIRSLGAVRGRSYLQRVLRAASLAGTAKSASRFDGSRVGRGFGSGRVLAARDRLSAFRTRRVIVKTRVVKVRGTGAKAATLHLRYIQRDGVTREGEAGVLYGRDTDMADDRAFLERGREDRHQFRFIVSAEDAGEYPDLKPFVRKLMARMEADLGTGLDWVAVDHHNTGHPHTHVVLRGKDDMGQDLIIARDYIAHGMRERAAEIITLDLGLRTDLEIEDRFANQVAQERLTDIDRALLRATDLEGHVTLAGNKGAVARQHWAGRLKTLERLDLADEIMPGCWKLASALEPTLRQMGERGDIIKTVHRELAAQSHERAPADLVIFDQTQPITGSVLARGLNDDREDAHYLVVDGVDGRVHYADVPDTLDPRVSVGAIVRLGQASEKPRAVDITVEAIAANADGRYSATLHRLHDPSASDAYIRAHLRRLEAMRRVGGLVTRDRDGMWTIPVDHAVRGLAFDQKRASAGVTLLSAVPLEKITQLQASTWLDQELLCQRPMPLHDGGFGAATRSALNQRQTWLIEEGLARKEGDRIFYRPDVLAKLRARELDQAGQTLAHEMGKAYRRAGAGTLEGSCRGPVDLVSGRFAIIETAREFALVPWHSLLERQIGKPVSGLMHGDAVSWTIGRSRGPSIT